MRPWIRAVCLLIVAALAAVRAQETTASHPTSVPSNVDAGSVALVTTPLVVGKASYYASRFHGRRTASGSVYDEAQWTAAHPTLPFGTLLKVTNLANLKSVIVRVTDRGPYMRSRVLDLSRSAAREIGMIDRGVAKVSVEKVEG